MSITNKKVTGIVTVLLYESEGHTVTVETKNSDMYRGFLFQAEDNMNIQLTNATLVDRRGRTSNLDHVFIRGSQIRFVIVPDILKECPMFRRVIKFKDAKRQYQPQGT